MKVLLIRFSSIGDVIIHSSHVHYFLQLKNNILDNPSQWFLKDLKIHFLTGSELKPLLEPWEDIDKLWTFDRRQKKSFLKLWKLSSTLAQENFDFIFDAHGSTRSILLTVFLKIRLVLMKGSCFFSLIPKMRLRRWFYFQLSKLIYTKQQSKQLYRKEKKLSLFIEKLLPQERWWLLARKQLHQDFMLFLENRKIYFPHEKLNFAIDHPPSLKLTNQSPTKKKSIVICPGATWEAKKWPQEKFWNLVENLLRRFPEMTIILLGTKNERKEFLESPLSPMVSQHLQLKNLMGETSLFESAQMIGQSLLTISNDSGMMHLSESLNVPVIGIFGATAPQLGFSPHLSLSKIIHLDLTCSPCGHLGQNKCRFKNNLCLESISVDMVLRQVDEILNSLDQSFKNSEEDVLTGTRHD
jgi:ADP-heptose:LPS heptosyltransferase